MAHDIGRSARYSEILRASAIIGGASMLTVLASSLRGKIAAILLGPAGIGLMGLYGSVLDLIQGTTGFGLVSGGVRQIAAAHASGSSTAIARTIVALRVSALFVGSVGAIVVIAAAPQISQWTFGSIAYATPVAFLAVAVALRAVSDGEGALLQGLRRMDDIARASVLAALLGVCATSMLLWQLRDRGVVPALVAAAALTAAINSYYSRRATATLAGASLREGLAEARHLLTIGGAFLISAALTALAAFVIRRTVRDSHGLAAAGFYHAAWTLGGTYVGFVLQAMGTDFYPRLTGTLGDDAACNRMVNEQAHVSVLLAGPGVAATLAVAPMILSIFYSSSFHAAAEPLRWIALGMLLRVVSWPMGFIILARGATAMFIAAELAAFAVHVGLALWLVPIFGGTGAGIAFTGLYVWHSCFVYVLVRHLTGFRWSPVTRRSAAIIIALVGITLVSSYVLSGWAALAVQLAAATAAGIYSLNQIGSVLFSGAWPLRLQHLIKRA